MKGLTYTLCAEPGCPLFVEKNEARRDDSSLAEWVHLHRDDDADRAIDESHEPVPGETHELSWWRQNGPAQVQERFVA